MMGKHAEGYLSLWPKITLSGVGSLQQGIEEVDEHTIRHLAAVDDGLCYLKYLFFDRLNS